MKGNDDLRCEVIAMQIIKKFKEIFKNLPLFLRPYDIIVTSQDSGFIEFIPDTHSIDYLKKNFHENLFNIYLTAFEQDWLDTQQKFAQSLAAYSLITYFLNLRDRHNGNILIDRQGHIIHIDFSYIFQKSPGDINFEKAPFKLTQEYIDILGGKDSDMFQYFQCLIVKGFLIIRQNFQQIINIIKPFLENKNLECFYGFDIDEFQEKFRLDLTQAECFKFVTELIDDSLNSLKTKGYDHYQYWTNGILS